jgi:nucleotide-binding universal stress UspA family protein
MKPIVIATDLTRASEPAVLQGMTLARDLNADVVLVHAWEPSSFTVLDATLMESPEHVAAKTRALQEALDVVAERYRPEETRLTSKLVEGRPADVIANLVRETGARLVVVGTHEKTGLRRILGSTADEIVRTSPVPVLVVHAHHESS